MRFLDSGFDLACPSLSPSDCDVVDVNSIRPSLGASEFGVMFVMTIHKILSFPDLMSPQSLGMLWWGRFHRDQV